MKKKEKKYYINFNNIYLFKTKPKIIPVLKKIIAILITIISIIYITGSLYCLIKTENQEEKIYFIKKIIIFFSLFYFFINIFIIYKNLKKFKTSLEKYSVSIVKNLLLIFFYLILIIILFWSENKNILNKEKSEIMKINENINFLILSIFLLKTIIIFILFFLRPKIDIKKIKKLNEKILMCANNNIYKKKIKKNKKK